MNYTLKQVVRFRDEVLNTKGGYDPNYFNGDEEYSQRVYKIVFPRARKSVVEKFPREQQRFAILKQHGDKLLRLSELLSSDTLCKELDMPQNIIYLTPLELLLDRLFKGIELVEARRYAIDESLEIARERANDSWQQEDFIQYRTSLQGKLGNLENIFKRNNLKLNY